MTDYPKLWGDMTREEKGALLLAHHEGKTIERFIPGCAWKEVYTLDDSELWHDHTAYRMRPEPVRKTEFVRLVNDDDIIVGKAIIETVNGRPDWSTLNAYDR